MMSDTNELFSVTVEPRGWRFEAPASMSVLEAARRSGIDLPASCRNGTCRTCMCRMTAGRIKYRIEWPGLSAEEKKDGFILPCAAYPDSDVVIEVDKATRLAPTTKSM